MNIPFVDLRKQYLSIKDEIDDAITKVINHTAFVGGSFVKLFESEFAKFCGSKNCIGVGNGTDALFLALKALGICDGDEVITAANSFIATSEAISMAGANVVFADINSSTYNIDINRIEEKISSKTKAIIPVHFSGQPVDMEPILGLAQKYNLKIVEDAAQAHDALYRGRKIGSIGDMTCFSFYPGKNLGAYGDAGAIVTDNDQLALRARMLANHGRIAKYNHEMEGINSRLDGIQAAILEVKLRHLPKWTEKRRENAYFYNELLKNTELVTPIEITHVRAVYHLYLVRLQNGRRNELQDFLKSRGIATGIHYPIPLPSLKAYKHLNYKQQDFPEATKASQEILSLPMFPELSEAEISYITKAIKDFFARH